MSLYLCLRVLVECPDVFFFHYITVILPINYGSIPSHHHLLNMHPVIVILLPIIDTPRSPSGPSILQVLPRDVLLQQHTCFGVIYPGVLDKSHKTNITNCTTPEGGTICLLSGPPYSTSLYSSQILWSWDILRTMSRNHSQSY